MINTHPDGLSDPPYDRSLFKGRIDFQLAQKTFTTTGFSNGGVGFLLDTPNPTISDRGIPGGLYEKEPDGSEFLDVGLDPELSFRITLRRIGAGLENLGNTCFLNSVLQCLTYMEPLAAYLQSGKHQNSCRTAGFCALCAIQKHVSRALQLTGRSLAPKDLVSNLWCISRKFRNARQEDAHEYMVNLLESMHKCCLPAGVPCESPSAYEKSLVHKIFGGFLSSQVKCMQCSFCSNKFYPFLDLSLEIITAESLYQTLLHFTAKEYLDGGEKQYQCQRCKRKAPYVLTIHLKRFATHQPGQKIDKKIQFGPTLDLKPFVSGPCDGPLRYTLYGVLVHAGWSTHSGHYYCYVRTSSGMWYSLDDHQVCQVSEKTFLEQKAYMLFYVQDRRNFASTKFVDVVQKESMVINAMGNKTLSNFNQGLKEIVQNRPIDKRVDSVDSSDKTSQKIDNEVSLQEHDENAFQKIVLSKESALDDCGPSMGVIELEDLSSPGMIHMSLHQETLDLKPQRKLKRKLQKCRVTGMHLGSSILFGISLSLRKEKHKKIEQCTVKIKNLTKQHLLEGQCSPTDLQPSTSERTMMLSLGGTVHSQRKGLKCGSSLKDNSAVANNVKSSNYDSVQEGIFHEEFRDKLDENGSKESRRDSLENGFMSMLTRGLEETIVARWDGLERTSSQITESSGVETINIGCVADEWGKRKKVRSSNNVFAGSNPFEEIATKREKLKDQSGCGNQPFRI
ncbi:Ubiquitin carboxyl-terminal hydrolase 23 [Camellia lanceoleosa]|uniref:Ubiquitin carboxyl-terminal hydrolase 23 n=1 Tax=Camellia lanceoleosa TaxID=1840588 RepID=A0ACC0I6X8_9ERIC|nr:Ubiquitin carboxyl-terminal hydrolase 23 [Camellia lanceoleosa]